MGFKLTGESEVTRNMENLKKALNAAFTGLSFNPQKPEEVVRAIREIEMKIDMKFAPYISTPGVREIATELKAEYRKAINEKASATTRTKPPA